MNKVFIVGRLTRPPEARTTTQGISVTTFTVAVTRRQNREEADFLNVVTWRGLADNCARYLTQGQQVAVSGEIRTRSYEANDGSKRYVTEIQADDVEFLARPGGSSAPSGNYQNNAGTTMLIHLPSLISQMQPNHLRWHQVPVRMTYSLRRWAMCWWKMTIYRSN